MALTPMKPPFLYFLVLYNPTRRFLRYLLQTYVALHSNACFNIYENCRTENVPLNDIS